MADPNWRKKLLPVLDEATTLASLLLGSDSTVVGKLAKTKCVTEGQAKEISTICGRDGPTQAARRLFEVVQKLPTPYFVTFWNVLDEVDEGKSLRSLLQKGIVASTSGEGLPHDYLDKNFTRDGIMNAAKLIQLYWRPIAEALGPKPFEERELDSFQEKKHSQCQAQAMLDSWASKNGKEATRRRLISAMEKEGFSADAAALVTGRGHDLRVSVYHRLARKFARFSSVFPSESSVRRRRKNESQLRKDVSDEKTPGPVNGSPLSRSCVFKFFVFVFIVGVVGGTSIYFCRSSKGKDAPSKLTGATVSMTELVQAIVRVGQLRWKDIAEELGWTFTDIEVLQSNHPFWSCKEKLQKILSDYQESKGDNKPSRQQLIDVCYKINIEGALRDALSVRK